VLQRAHISGFRVRAADLAAAIAARAEVVVSYDKDLLVLEKPFGVEILRPAQLLRRIKG